MIGDRQRRPVLNDAALWRDCPPEPPVAGREPPDRRREPPAPFPPALDPWVDFWPGFWVDFCAGFWPDVDPWPEPAPREP